MDSTSLIKPDPVYGYLPSLFVVSVFIIIYYIFRLIKWYRHFRRKQREVLQQYVTSRQLIEKESFNWSIWCKNIKPALQDFNKTGNLFFLYKAVLLCISCRAEKFWLNRSPLQHNLPLVNQDNKIALESLYISLYSRHPLARIYLEKLIKLIKSLGCV